MISTHTADMAYRSSTRLPLPNDVPKQKTGNSQFVGLAETEVLGETSSSGPGEGYAWMLNSMTGPVLPTPMAPPISTTSKRAMTSGYKLTSMATFVRAPVHMTLTLCCLPLPHITGGNEATCRVQGAFRGEFWGLRGGEGGFGPCHTSGSNEPTCRMHEAFRGWFRVFGQRGGGYVSAPATHEEAWNQHPIRGV